VPIYQTAAYEFDSAEHGAALFNLEVEGFRYSRISNPTTASSRSGSRSSKAASARSASPRARRRCTTRRSTSPRWAATSSRCRSSTAPPTPCSRTSCRSSGRRGSLRQIRPRRRHRGLIDENTRACSARPSAIRPATSATSRRSPNVAHRHGVPLIVDNTVATPILLRPIEHGADIVVHSLTKFMGGHGTTLGGASSTAARFPGAHAARFPMFTEPDESYHGLVYTEHYGAAAFIGRCRSVYQRTTGAVLAPMSAFLLLQGIETVALRIERHVENARKVAEFLRADPRVESVNYAGFADSPYHGAGAEIPRRPACSLLTFGVRGGLPPACGSTTR
jgi:O-acetylhomoserine (thiol)-lyase